MSQQQPPPPLKLAQAPIQKPKPLTKAQLFSKDKVEVIMKYKGNNNATFLNMVKPMKKYIPEWTAYVSGCKSSDGLAWREQLKKLIDTIYHEIRGAVKVDDLEEDSDSGLIDVDEVLRPEDEEDKAFVVDDEDEPVREEEEEEEEEEEDEETELYAAFDKKKNKRKRSNKNIIREQEEEEEEEEENHVELYSAMEQDDDREDEEHYTNLLLSKKTEPPPATKTVKFALPLEDVPVVVVQKPAIINKAIIPVADLADGPKEFKSEKEFLVSDDDESIDMSEEEEVNDVNETESDDVNETESDDESEEGQAEEAEEEAEEEEEEENDNPRPSKKPKSRIIEVPESRFYQLGEKFILKGQEYEVTSVARKITPLISNGEGGDEIDWDNVTYDHLSVCKGPPANKKSPESDYNAFVFSYCQPPHMISIKQAQKIDAKIEKSEREHNRREAVKYGNIKRGFTDSKKGKKVKVEKHGKEVEIPEINTYMPMNYFRQLAKKRKSRTTTSTTATTKKQPLKDSTAQRSNVAPPTATEKGIALEMLKSLSKHKELFKELPAVFEKEFAMTLDTMNSQSLKSLFIPAAEEFIKTNQDCGSENRGEVIRRWTARYGNSPKVLEIHEKHLIKFFMQHVVFLNEGCKAALVKRLKVLAGSP